MKKTKLVATLGAVALIGVIGVGSTFAYLTDQTATVTNTFTVGDVTFDDDNEVGSGLRESAVVRDAETGSYVDNDGADTWTVITNEYTNLAAGEEVYKDPTVVMGADSQNAWVFAKVTNVTNEAFSEVAWSADWTDVTAEYKVANGITEDVDYVVFAKNTIIAAEEASTIFTSVTLSTDVTGETVIPEITVQAFAIQAAGFDSYEAAISEVAFN